MSDLNDHSVDGSKDRAIDEEVQEEVTTNQNPNGKAKRHRRERFPRSLNSSLGMRIIYGLMGTTFSDNKALAFFTLMALIFAIPIVLLSSILSIYSQSPLTRRFKRIAKSNAVENYADTISVFEKIKSIDPDTKKTIRRKIKKHLRYDKLAYGYKMALSQWIIVNVIPTITCFAIPYIVVMKYSSHINQPVLVTLAQATVSSAIGTSLFLLVIIGTFIATNIKSKAMIINLDMMGIILAGLTVLALWHKYFHMPVYISACVIVGIWLPMLLLIGSLYLINKIISIRFDRRSISYIVSQTIAFISQSETTSRNSIAPTRCASLIRSLENIALAIEVGIYHGLDCADLATSQFFQSWKNEVAASVREYKKWILLPLNDTDEYLAMTMAKFLANLVNNNWKDFPRMASEEKPKLPLYKRVLGPVTKAAQSIAIGAIITFMTWLILRIPGIVPSLISHSIASIFMFDGVFYCAISFASMLDPHLKDKFELSKDLTALFRK